MSRLMADQESRGGEGDPGAGEGDSVMGMTLAEGCGAVNDETRRLLGKSHFYQSDPGSYVTSPPWVCQDSLFVQGRALPLASQERLSCVFGLFGSKNERNQTNQLTRQTGPIPPVSRVSCGSPARFGELCSLDGFLYKNDCAGHRFSAPFPPVSCSLRGCRGAVCRDVDELLALLESRRRDHQIRSPPDRPTSI